jgi:beta-lactamase superfamily II metal-dependent hydrolase
MSIVKSYSVGHGAMYYVKHNSSNFTVIDCRLVAGDTMEPIIEEIVEASRAKDVARFISTHPDDDHIKGIVELDEAMELRNFYCVDNAASRDMPTDAFLHYCALRDSDKAFNIYRSCRRKWMNVSDEKRGHAGINFQWPVTDNADYQAALDLVADGGRANNISPIFTYAREGGARFMWMGDLETEFMERVKDELTDLPQVDILFAPHHGRDTPPEEWMKQLNPQVVILGEADEEYLDPYTGWTKMRQSRAGDLTFECVSGKTHIYASEKGYSHKALRNEGRSDTYGKYLGTIDAPRTS